MTKDIHGLWLELEEPIMEAGRIAQCLILLGVSELVDKEAQDVFSLMGAQISHVHERLNSLFEGGHRHFQEAKSTEGVVASGSVPLTPFITMTPPDAIKPLRAK